MESIPQEVSTTHTSRMALYSSWLDQRWAEWRRINGVSPGEPRTYAHYRAFDAWLQFLQERNQLDPRALTAASSPG